MKRMVVRITDEKGKLIGDYVVVKTDFRLFLDQVIKFCAIVLSSIGLATLIYLIFFI